MKGPIAAEVSVSYVSELGIPLNKFPSSEAPKFRELQVPNFQVPGTSSSEMPN